MATGYRAGIRVAQAGSIIYAATALHNVGRVAQAALFEVAQLSTAVIPFAATAMEFVAKHTPRNDFIMRVINAGREIIFPKNIHMINSLKNAGIAFVTSLAFSALADFIHSFEAEDNDDTSSIQSNMIDQDGSVPLSYRCFTLIFGLDVVSTDTSNRVDIAFKSLFELPGHLLNDLIVHSD